MKAWLMFLVVLALSSCVSPTPHSVVTIPIRVLHYDAPGGADPRERVFLCGDGAFHSLPELVSHIRSLKVVNPLDQDMVRFEIDYVSYGSDGYPSHFSDAELDALKSACSAARFECVVEFRGDPAPAFRDRRTEAFLDSNVGKVLCLSGRLQWEYKGHHQDRLVFNAGSVVFLWNASAQGLEGRNVKVEGIIRKIYHYPVRGPVQQVPTPYYWYILEVDWIEIDGSQSGKAAEPVGMRRRSGPRR